SREISARPLPAGTSCTPGSCLSAFAGFTMITARLPYSAISAGRPFPFRESLRPRRSTSVTMARPRSASRALRRARTSSGSVTVGACGSGTSPATPSATPAGPKLTAPTPDSPADGSAIGSFRPTLVVLNGTSDQSGDRQYEFQISDRSDFSSAPASLIHAFTVVARQVGVPEGAGGTTSYTPDFDLQPTTRLYWRARLQQGTTAS